MRTNFLNNVFYNEKFTNNIQSRERVKNNFFPQLRGTENGQTTNKEDMQQRILQA